MNHGSVSQKTTIQVLHISGNNPNPTAHPQEVLTPRQREILDFIRNHLAESGAPPTRLEICAAFGFASPNAAEDHLRALVKKGRSS
ncbi:MAG: hypothetical protein Q8O25_07620 [Sulfurisoma sp.]|nr:hypothetical protein [Sulfurisoma sp.]